MQANRQRDTSPEIAVRRILHAHGLRYRVDVRPEPGIRRRADIVFPRRKLAVFIDGCFWHGCPQHGSRSFKTNAAFWELKIERNMARDLDTTARLEAAGWRVLRFWEHLDPATVATLIESEARAVEALAYVAARAETGGSPRACDFVSMSSRTCRTTSAGFSCSQ
jgi:DNA mismatch endonuclease (patch repair protein)